MSSQNKHIGAKQIASYLLGECSPERAEEIRQWINISDENQQFFQECKKVLDQKYDDPYQEIDGNFNKEAAWKNINSKIENLPGDKNEIGRSISVFKWLQIAAMILVIFVAIFYIWKPFEKPVVLSSLNSQKEVFLPDSTRIVLRKQSTIRFNKSFNKRNRNVELTGEAYFDVTHNPDLSFIILTKHARIEVIGTAFSVKDTPDSVLVQVHRGTVKMSSLSEQKVSQILQKDQQGLLDVMSDKIRKEIVEEPNKMYWGNKTLTYTRRPLTDVLDELARIFDKDIVYDKTVLSNCRISGAFKDQAFEEVLKNIALALKFTYHIDGNKVEIESAGCE